MSEFNNYDLEIVREKVKKTIEDIKKKSIEEVYFLAFCYLSNEIQIDYFEDFLKDKDVFEIKKAPKSGA